MTPNRPEHADKVTPVAGVSPRFTIRRRLVGYAYAANGNLHNPTPEYAWDLLVDGARVDQARLRRVLVAAARTDGQAYLDEIDGRNA